MKIDLMDSTLRDGGYINDWNFGRDAIQGIRVKLAKAGLKYIEIGFIKGNIPGNVFSEDRTMYPDIRCIADVIAPKEPDVTYVGMLDMSAPISYDDIVPCDGSSVDALRVIFKKNKMQEGYDCCKYCRDQGYKVFVQPVGTDNYSDKEFIELIEKFNDLEPYAFYIVDSFGLIKRKQFLRLMYLADNNLCRTSKIGYHSHNNLQQAFGNAESAAEMSLSHDLILDACVFGMGRGAGNLNMELFAEYLNENCGAHYRLEPMLEIIDEYLNEIHEHHFWGYSLPFYLSATNNCHPNYALYFSEKGTLTEKSFNELLKSIPKEKKAVYNKADAEEFYKKYMEVYIDDKDTVKQLSLDVSGKKILLLAPGASLNTNKDSISKYIEQNRTLVFAVNFYDKVFKTDYIFSSNMRRYAKLESVPGVKKIITSNIKEAKQYDYTVNFSSYSCKEPDIIDNSGLMALKLLMTLGIKDVAVAGMDGYSINNGTNYFDCELDYDFSKQASKRNKLISDEIKNMSDQINVDFITPSIYSVSGIS